MARSPSPQPKKGHEHHAMPFGKARKRGETARAVQTRTNPEQNAACQPGQHEGTRRKVCIQTRQRRN